MSLLIRGQNIGLSYGHHPLFEQTSFAVHKNDRIAIIGMNGMGKSSLLKLIHGDSEPDHGKIEYAKGLKIAMLQQDVPQHLSGSLADYYQSLCRDHPIAEYEHQRIISQLGLTEELLLENASGGQIRRVLLGATLLHDPDVLLLDEPTNHMDIETILWMEKFLLRMNKTIIFITHDRSFMQKLATHIFEIDLGRIIAWQGDYQGFLRHKETEDKARERAEVQFDKKMAQEEIWIRQGIKARRTRNEGRVRALEAMRRERQKRQQQMGKMRIVQQRQEYASKIAFDVSDLSYSCDGQNLITDLSTLIMRGDKIGIIGPNGCGKSTLFRLLTGEIEPSSGQIKIGTQCEISYFDQHREQLDLNQTALDNVSQGRSQITINGKSKHVISYLQDFLFSPDKARSPVRALSGGERNRLLLAKILSQPSNVLILDEPSNDLDTETLALLEEFLSEYPGTVLMASHDRSLLDNVVSSLLVFRGDGEIEEYVGDYAQWQEQESRQAKARKKAVSSGSDSSDNAKAAKKTKLSYNDARELKQLPGKIETLEAEIKAEQQAMGASDFYKQDADTIARLCQAHEDKKESLQECYRRWEALEE